MNLVLIESIRIVQDVVLEYHGEDVQVFPEYVINEMLEDGQQVSKTKMLDGVLQVSIVGAESDHPFLPLVNAEQVVSAPTIPISVGGDIVSSM